jgi:hypothetical protein
MQFYALIGCPQVGPFGRRLLHAVLAEDALPGFEEWHDLISGKGLADGDQFHPLGRRAEAALRLVDARADAFESFGWTGIRHAVDRLRD